MLQTDTSDRLVDLRSISVDMSLSPTEKMNSFLIQIKNPYLFKVDDITVKVTFSAGKTLDEALLDFLLAERNR